MTDQWIQAPEDLAPHIGLCARIPDADGGWRVGRIRNDGETIALDNNSVLPIGEDLELLDLANLDPYDAWLRSKVAVDAAAHSARDLDRSRLNSRLDGFPHEGDAVAWAYRKKRAALFESFGLGKTIQQLELLYLIAEDYTEPSKEAACGGMDHGPRLAPVLQVCPLGVQAEFIEEAEKLGYGITRIRTTEEARPGINLTHYEAVRDGKVSPRAFAASSLDEAACLRGMGSTETFRSFMTLFEGLEYKFVATATPSPNDIIEIGAYAAYLEVMDIADMKTRYFKRNSEKADDLTLLPGREMDFFIWLSTWALFIESPADLGHDGSAYVLPEITVRWHMVDDPEDFVAVERSGQALISAEMESSIGLANAAALKRATMTPRLAKLKEIVDSEPRENFILWHDLEDERRAIERLFPEAWSADLANGRRRRGRIPAGRSVYGSQDLEEREEIQRAFKAGKIRLLATKPRILGAGFNGQKHCRRAIFAGVGYKAYEVLQAVRRIHRFGQTRPVIIDLIYSRAERAIKDTLERKWAEDVKLRSQMCEIVREYGLADRAMSEALQRERHVDRREANGKSWTWICNDSVREWRNLPDDHFGLIFGSPPFAGMYQYASHVADLSFSDDNDHFWRGMGFLIPELYRTLKPGRILVLHAKDRVVPGNLSGHGFGSIYHFSDACIRAFTAHGFVSMGRVTVSTDVVRENAGTYRLGYTEKRKDATKIGHGLPEYLLILRKPPTSSENAYADEPVSRPGPDVIVDGEQVPYRPAKPIVPGTGWSRAEWQVQADGFWRSNGNRIASPAELADRESKAVYQAWRAECSSGPYDYHRHVALVEAVLAAGRLPTGFGLLPAHALKNDPGVWSDIARMRTLNMIQARRGREMHLCPLQFDIAERVIDLWSSPGDIVADPWGGIGTVPMFAAKAGRFGFGCELSGDYWHDGRAHLEAQDAKLRQLSLFDYLGAPAEDQESISASPARALLG